MAMRVLDGEIDRFLSAALASASRAPPRSRRNSYFSADASGSSCPKADSWPERVLPKTCNAFG